MIYYILVPFETLSVSPLFLATEAFIHGSKVIKKNNIRDYVNKSQTHNTAVRRLGEIRKGPASSSSNNLNSSSSASCSSIPKQATVLTHMQKLATRHRSQLKKIFESTHFIVSEGHVFNFYSKLAHFEKTS